MRDALARMRNANAELWRLPLDDSEKSRIEEVEATLLQSDAAPLEALALSDLEETLDSILRSHGQIIQGIYRPLWQDATCLQTHSRLC